MNPATPPPRPDEGTAASAHIVSEPAGNYHSQRALTPEEKKLVARLVEDGLAIQDRFRPEPLFRETGKGHFESKAVDEMKNAQRARQNTKRT